MEDNWWSKMRRPLARASVFSPTVAILCGALFVRGSLKIVRDGPAEGAVEWTTSKVSGARPAM